MLKWRRDMSEDNRGRPGTRGQSNKGPAASKKTLPITYDHGRVQNRYLFATPADRGFYIRANCSETWLNEHPDVWVLDPRANQETSPTRARAQTEPPVQEVAAETPSDVSSPGIQTDAKLTGAAESGNIAANFSAPQQPALDAERLAARDTANGPGPEGEITIDGKRHLSANRYAAMKGISRRTLTRWEDEEKTPPKRKIGNKVWFEVP
jgi:hypothetical protein